MQNAVRQNPSIRWTDLGARWTARLTAAFLLGMVLLFYVGEGPLGDGGPNPLKMDWIGRLALASHLVCIAGLVILWWRELPGGLCVVGGMAVFFATNLLATGRLPGPAFHLYYVPGFAALLSWMLHLRRA
jgi:hypothetical protein